MKETQMLQQINLYNFLPQEKKPWLTLKKLYTAYGLFIIILIFKWGNILWTNHQLTKEKEKEVILLAETKQQFKNLIQRYPTIDIKNMQTIGENLQLELANQLKIIKMLAQTSKFSAYMRGLSAAAMDGSWLTDISFSANEPHVILKGDVLRPQLAQQLLDQLVVQPIFSELSLKIDELNKINLDKNVVFTFVITSKGKAKNSP